MTVSGSTPLGGNYAYYDTVAAVRWVKENIRAFGGDPERVTVYGMSSGATLAATLAIDVKAPTVYGAIIMSNPFALAVKSQSSMQAMGDAIARKVHCGGRHRGLRGRGLFGVGPSQLDDSEYDGDDSDNSDGAAESVVACLRRRPAALLCAASIVDRTSFQHRSLDGRPMGDILYWSLSVDHDHIHGSALEVLAAPPVALRERLRRMSFIVGTSDDEMAFFTNPVTMNGRLGNIFFALGKGTMPMVELVKSRRLANLWHRFTAWLRRKIYSSSSSSSSSSATSSTASSSSSSSSSSNAKKILDRRNVRLYRNVIAQLFGNGDYYHPRVDAILEHYPATDDSNTNIRNMKQILNDYMFKCSSRMVFPLLACCHFSHPSLCLCLCLCLPIYRSIDLSSPPPSSTRLLACETVPKSSDSVHGPRTPLQFQADSELGQSVVWSWFVVVLVVAVDHADRGTACPGLSVRISQVSTAQGPRG